MSKSIYDEVLDILADSLQDPQDEEDNSYILDFKQMNKIFRTIRQAQKQEKLLELYEEINNKHKELITQARHNTWSWKLDIEINEMRDKIKELDK